MKLFGSGSYKQLVRSTISQRINMGSSCSILNDTEHDVWITHGINWTVLLLSVGGVFGVLTAGIGLAALGASLGVGGALAGGGALIMAEEGIIMGTAATTLAGLTATQWTIAGVVTNLSATALAQALNISREKAENLRRQVQQFQEKAELVKPGEKYTWSGSLSLTMKVYVMNDKLQCDEKACFTGPTARSEKVYSISEDFKKLDVTKEAGDMISVYSSSKYIGFMYM